MANVTGMVEKICSADGLKNSFDIENEYSVEGEWQLAEVYSWYIVDDWFAGKLAENGEVVLDGLGNRIWGRRVFGQMIASDGVVETIYNDLVKD